MHREIAYDPVFDAQEHYRLLLDAMARPGTIRVLPRMPISVPEGLTTAAALIGFALLNADVSFNADGGETVTRYLVVNTSARPVDRALADFVFADGMSPASLLTGMKTGTLPYPEDGATLILQVKALAATAEGLTAEGLTAEGLTAEGLTAEGLTDPLAIRLQGPGVNGERKLFVSGLNSGLLDALRECNMEFPLGIDLVMTDPGHRIACIPRSSRAKEDNNHAAAG